MLLDLTDFAISEFLPPNCERIIISFYSFQISWWNGNREVPSSSYGKLEHENGTGSTESEISVRLQRSHLGKSFTCKVNRYVSDYNLQISNYHFIKHHEYVSIKL